MHSFKLWRLVMHRTYAIMQVVLRLCTCICTSVCQWFASHPQVTARRCCKRSTMVCASERIGTSSGRLLVSRWSYLSTSATDIFHSVRRYVAFVMTSCCHRLKLSRLSSAPGLVICFNRSLGNCRRTTWLLRHTMCYTSVTVLPKSFLLFCSSSLYKTDLTVQT